MLNGFLLATCIGRQKTNLRIIIDTSIDKKYEKTENKNEPVKLIRFIFHHCSANIHHGANIKQTNRQTLGCLEHDESKKKHWNPLK